MTSERVEYQIEPSRVRLAKAEAESTGEFEAARSLALGAYADKLRLAEEKRPGKEEDRGEASGYLQ